MLSVYRTLSVRYLGRRWLRALLIVLSIALGVATLVATRALNETMTRAGLASVNPMPGVVDLVVNNGESTITGDLATKLAQIPGVEEASPRIFENIKLPDLGNRTALVMGIDFRKETQTRKHSLDVEFVLDEDVRKIVEETKRFVSEHRKEFASAATKRTLTLFIKPFLNQDWKKVLDQFVRDLPGADSTDDVVIDSLSRLIPPVWVGEELRKELDRVPPKQWELPGWLKLLPDKIKKGLGKIGVERFLSHLVVVKRSPQAEAEYLLCIGTVKARGIAAVLGGHTLSMDLPDAAKLLGLTAGQVNRIDVKLRPKAKKTKVREQVEELARGHGVVRTPEEHNEAIGNVMSGMQKGFGLSGLAALVVGLFLVYNALAVSVAERRHEVGILLSLGATRRQVCFLFAGEAAALGLTGALLGIPLGIGLAYLGLQPTQDVLRDIFYDVEANQVEVSLLLMVVAVGTGIATAVAAALIPAMSAARENPAAAVRQVSKAASRHYLAWQVGCMLGLVGLGLVSMFLRERFNLRAGAYAGMILVLLGALIAAPLITAGIARLLQPVAQRFFPITWRLAADNLVRAPGRTGLVIAALAAGVALVTQTYGTTVSNRTALREWVENFIAADLIVSAGSPVGASGGQSAWMKEDLGEEIRKIPGVEAALPNSDLLLPYGDTQVKLYAFDAAESYRLEKERLSKPDFVELYRTVSEQPHTAIVSENFEAVHGVHKGDTVNLSAQGREIKLLVIGSIADYSWNHGTIFIDREEFKRRWDNKVKVFDVYVQPGANVEQVKETLNQRLAAQNGLVIQTRSELQHMIADVIERLYGLALSLQVVVMFVAALGVVTALLISVLQRRREMGLLRAIGASGAQVVRSFLAEAFLMGVIGTIIGFLVGIPMEWYVLKVLILQESGYLFAVHVPGREAVVIIGAGLTIPILAGIGPALTSIKQRIPEAIAYE